MKLQSRCCSLPLSLFERSLPCHLYYSWKLMMHNPFAHWHCHNCYPFAHWHCRNCYPSAHWHCRNCYPFAHLGQGGCILLSHTGGCVGLLAYCNPGSQGHPLLLGKTESNPHC